VKRGKWPKYVGVRKDTGVIFYRPRIPPEKQHLVETKSGFLSPPIKLGRLSDHKATILENYNTAVQFVQSKIDGAKDSDTLYGLLEKYKKSRQFLSLARDTQDDYTTKLSKLLRHPVEVNRVKTEFGALQARYLTTQYLRLLLDDLLETYQAQGMSGVSITNGQFRCLSAMLSYGIQYDTNIGLESNPCMGVRLHKPIRKDRYVTDEEYYLQCEFACAHGADYLPVFFEHAYLLASRSIEVYNLTVNDVIEEGYLVDRRKGSKTNLILWTMRLEKAFELALCLREKHNARHDYLITSSVGPVRREALKSAMSRLKKRMVADGHGDIFWTLHDLKRKGISDAENKNIGGHRSREMEQRYNTVIEAMLPPEKGTATPQNRTFVHKR